MSDAPSKQQRESVVLGRAAFSDAGFTLIELMIVVLIMGILATIGTVSFRGHLEKSHKTTAVAMVRSIAGAQTQFRAEHGTYLNVSDSLAEYYPSEPDGTSERNFYLTAADTNTNNKKWRQLAPKAPALVRFGFATVAGLPAAEEAPAGLDGRVPLTWPNKKLIVEPWYIIQAVDGGGSLIVATSFNSQIYQE